MRTKWIGSVVLLAAAVSAPQAWWWLLSDERHTMTSAQVEQAVRQELEIANDLRLDRIVCEPITRPPGEALCDVQENDKISGVVFEVDADGSSDLSKVVPGDMDAWKP